MNTPKSLLFFLVPVGLLAKFFLSSFGCGWGGSYPGSYCQVVPYPLLVGIIVSFAASLILVAAVNFHPAARLSVIAKKVLEVACMIAVIVTLLVFADPHVTALLSPDSELGKLSSREILGSRNANDAAIVGTASQVADELRIYEKSYESLCVEGVINPDIQDGNHGPYVKAMKRDLARIVSSRVGFRASVTIENEKKAGIGCIATKDAYAVSITFRPVEGSGPGDAVYCTGTNPDIQYAGKNGTSTESCL